MLLSPKDFCEKDLSLNQIFLDPNNPRFATKKDVCTPDEKIVERSVQEECLLKMQRYELEDLKESIREVGFVQVDRVVVKPLEKKTGSYVVLEGNRRIAALKILEKEFNKGEIQINSDILKTITNFTAFVYKGNNPDMAWIIQGLRHISGVKSWPPYQKALTLHKMTNQGNDKKIKEAARALGISLKEATKLIRALLGFQNAREESDYSDELNPEHFSYFHEVIFHKVQLYQKYLDWHEKTKKFRNIENLNKLFSWVFPEKEKVAKITQAMQLRDDIVPVMIRHPLLFERWENEETMTVKMLNQEVGKIEQKQVGLNVDEWLDKIENFNEEIDELPILKIKDRKDEFINKLNKTREVCQGHLGILSKI